MRVEAEHRPAAAVQIDKGRQVAVERRAQHAHIDARARMGRGHIDIVDARHGWAADGPRRQDLLCNGTASDERQPVQVRLPRVSRCDSVDEPADTGFQRIAGDCDGGVRSWIGQDWLGSKAMHVKGCGRWNIDSQYSARMLKWID
jgi:hypothetical protein